MAQGLPLTVTHPEVTRFFMTIEEAVQLVIEAAGLGGDAQVLVLDMGEPVKIVDLAHNMIRLAGFEPETDIAVEFSGIRPGEKIAEELFGSEERPQPTAAKRILRAVRDVPLDQDWVISTVDRMEQLILAGDESNLSERIVELVSAPGGGEAAVVYDK